MTDDDFNFSYFNIYLFSDIKVHPLHGFDRENGLNALILLISFVKKHKMKAAIILQEFAETRRRFCSLVHLSCQLASLVTNALRLTPTPTGAKSSVSSLSKTPVWSLLDSESCLQEVFDVALMTFDDIWRHFTEKMEQKPTREIYELCTTVTNTLLKELLDSGPSGVEEMWAMWSEQRVRRQRALVDRKVQAISKSDSSSTLSSSDSGMREEVAKRFCGISTRILGGSRILTSRQIGQLEAALPTAQQCYDWRLLYRLSQDGNSLPVLLEKAKRAIFSLLVIRDTTGVVFGALITEKLIENPVYYGRGPASVAVWTFRCGVVELYPASLKDSQYIRVTPVSLALGGEDAVGSGDSRKSANSAGPAIYLHGKMQGRSMFCSTFYSPVLAGCDTFTCAECELFSLEHVLKGK